MMSARRKIYSEHGDALMELLVTLFLAATVMAAAATQFLDSTRYSQDQRVRMTAQEQARTILDLMAFELRMAGSGVPFSQANFQIGSAGLGNAPLPILTSSDSDSISFRLNETGDMAYLSADLTANPGALAVTVTDVSYFEDGDTVYISNMPRAGSEGLRGVVDSVSLPNTVNIAAGHLSIAGSVFEAGSSIERVTEISYESPGDGSGITRNAELGATLVNPGSSFSISYLDTNGNTIALPLSESKIRNQLASVNLIVNVVGSIPLKDGSTYTAQANQRVSLRNLNIAR